jgi:hypothetical protein
MEAAPSGGLRRVVCVSSLKIGSTFSSKISSASLTQVLTLF